MKGRFLLTALRGVLAVTLVASSCGCSGSAPESATASWVGSSDDFLARWNSIVGKPYQIESLPKGTTVLFTNGRMTSGGDMFIADTRDPSLFLPLCVNTVRSALGLSKDVATAVTKDALSRVNSDPGMPGYGLASFQGYVVAISVGTTPVFMSCTVNPSR